MAANFSSEFCANPSEDNTTSELWLVEDKTSAQVAASFLLLILVVGLPWNLLVVGAILKKKLYTQPTIILLLNLVLTDIFTLILHASSQVWVGFNGEYNYGGTDSIRCKVFQFGVPITVLPLTALYTVSYMSFDRFMLIYKPLKYDKIITCFRTLLVLGVTWVFHALISILPVISYGNAIFIQDLLACAFNHSHNYLYVILTTVLIPMVPTLVCNILWLLCIVQKNIRANYSVRRSPSSTASNQEEDRFYKVMKKQRHQKELHLVWVFVALVCCNLVTWLPIIIQALYFSLKMHFQPVFSTVAIVLFTSQALPHPFVETVLIKEVREQHKMIMLYCCVKINPSNITSSSPEPRHGCCGYCGDDAQSPGRSGCGLLDMCNAAILLNSSRSSRSDSTEV